MEKNSMTSEFIQEEKKEATLVTNTSGKENSVVCPRSWFWLNILLIVLVFLLVGSSIGFYYAKVQQMAQTINHLQAQTVKAEQARAIDNAIWSELQKTVSDQGNQLQQQHQSLQRLSLFEQQRQWRLDEIRYLINLANISLIFSHDAIASHKLLEQVHSNILALHDATLDVLDQAVQSDMKILAEMTSEDASQIFLQISTLDQNIDGMPLLGSGFSEDNMSPEEMAPVTHTWRDRLKQTLRQLRYFVDVRKTSNTLFPLVAQEQGEYINQYLHMQLGQAQWAVLHHDNFVYQASLNQANLWINRYFVILNPKTQDVLNALNALQEINASFSDVTLDKTINALSTLTNN
ncbi:MAG: uroporphyrinogen-III C-methyltransferase [Gammaproteobacteria bacterium]|nr:uroporphyrinogen-III C-methyltransferase [Gammaproteobacteria bacterium]